jgi:hypothetical protein
MLLRNVIFGLKRCFTQTFMFITGIKQGILLFPASEWVHIVVTLYIRIWDVLSSNPDRDANAPLFRSLRQKPDSTFIRLRLLPFKSFLVILLSDAHSLRAKRAKKFPFNPPYPPSFNYSDFRWTFRLWTCLLGTSLQSLFTESLCLLFWL